VGNRYSEENRGESVQEHPSVVIDRMNAAYNAVYGTISSETRMKAERAFYACQDWLRSRKIRFHQSLSGKWVLDSFKDAE
jgi:hypothetical protein